MTTSRVSILLGAAIGLAALAAPTTGAVAADLNYGGSVKDTYAPPAPGRTWYLRGFTGFSNYDSDEPNTELHTTDFDHMSHDYESAPFLGFGLGVQVNHWLRFEGTAEYRGNATFHGHDKYFVDLDGDGACTFDSDGDGIPDGGECGTNDYISVVESWVGLASVYADLFTWCGLTPFVGVGIGIASVDVKGMTDVNVPGHSVFHGSDNSETNFAWAVHAGAAYEVNDRLTLDIGYRYMDLGDASSGKMTAYDDSSSYKSVDLDDLHSHDLMIGMRWKLDRAAPAYVPVK